MRPNLSASPELAPQPLMMNVMVCYALPDRAWMKEVQASPTSTVRDLVEQCGFFTEHPDVSPETVSYGVFGKRVSPESAVGQGDRIEIYRSLTFDPKESRRRRAAHRAAKQKHQAKQNRNAGQP